MIKIILFGRYWLVCIHVSLAILGYFQIRDIFDELNLDRFHISNAFKRTDVYTFEKLSNLSINIIASRVCHDQTKKKHNK